MFLSGSSVYRVVSRALSRVALRFTFVVSAWGIVGLAAPLSLGQGDADAGAPERSARAAVEAFVEAWTFKDYEALAPMLAREQRESLKPPQLGAILEKRIPNLESALIVSFEQENASQWRARLVLAAAANPAAPANKTEASAPRTTPPGVKYTLRAVRETDESGAAVWRVRLPDLGVEASADSRSDRAPMAGQQTDPGAKDSPSPGLPPSIVVGGMSLDDVLGKIEDADKQVQSLTAEVHLQGTLLGQLMNDTGRLAMKKPNRFRLDLNLLVVAFDGASTTIYIPAAQAYATAPGQTGAFGLDLGPGLGASAAEMKSRYHLALTGRETFNGQSAYRIAARTRKPNSLLGDGALTLWIDAQTWMPVGTSYQTAAGNLDIHFRSLRVNPEGLADSEFRFQPPPGAMALPSLPGL